MQFDIMAYQCVSALVLFKKKVKRNPHRTVSFHCIYFLSVHTLAYHLTLIALLLSTHWALSFGSVNFIIFLNTLFSRSLIHKVNKMSPADSCYIALLASLCPELLNYLLSSISKVFTEPID